MGRIKQLPESVFSKIAAGEVIERPSNALKELIENSIDANSTNISVRILNSGLKLIEIRDNGIGIDKDDLPYTIQRYSTSKINSEEDLLKIQTFGFRGEALYAISQISNIQITSKTLEQEQAYTLVASEGKIIRIEPTSFNPKSGTIIKVNDLFFNSPVRRNFLKSEKIELHNIMNTFKQFAAINNNILFSLYVEDKLRHNFIPTTLESRVKEIFRIKEVALQIQEIEGYKITLVLSTNYKYDEKIETAKNNFYVYVNKRIVLMSELEKIVVNTFRTVLGERGRIEGIVSIELPPSEVDCNVHPRKLEVRFLKPIFLKDFLQKTIKNFINKYLLSKPIIFIDQQVEEKGEQINWYQNLKNTAQKIEEKVEKIEEKIEDKVQEKSTSSLLDFSNTDQKLEMKTNVMQSIVKLDNLEDKKKPKLLHYWDNCYFLVLFENNFFIVDQHNANEKVIYSKLLKMFREKEKQKIQKLLIPITLKVKEEENVEEIVNFLRKLGFEAELKEKELSILSFPSVFNINYIRETVSFIVDNFDSIVFDDEEIIKDVLSKVACKAAVKKGHKLSEEELLKIFNELIELEELNPYFCPHGRNVMVKISFKDIDKMFERE